MQGTKFRITHKRISSRILIRQKSTLQDQFPKLLSGSTKSASDTCLYLSHAVLTNRRDNSEIKQDSPTFSSTLSITNIDKSEDADIIICIARASSKYPEQEQIIQYSFVPSISCHCQGNIQIKCLRTRTFFCFLTDFPYHLKSPTWKSWWPYFPQSTLG